MDNLTHTLTGLMLSRAGLRRFTPGATAILILSANAPDADVVTALGGSVEYLHCHRGWTHALPFAPVMALIPVLLVGLVLWRGRVAEWKRHAAGAYAISLAGVLSHLLLDWTNTYGIRLLEPFSSRWFHADLVYIVDIWVWAAFLLVLGGSFLSRLLSSEMGARRSTGRAGAIFALGFYLAYVLLRGNLHDRALETLNARLYEGTAPVRVAAFPTPANPFRWQALVEGANSYALHDLNLLGEFDPTGGETFYKIPVDPAIEAARRTEPFRVFLAFAQYPLWRVEPVSGKVSGTKVRLLDLRFGTPANPGFVAEAILDENQRVVSSEFHFALPQHSAR